MYLLVMMTVIWVLSSVALSAHLLFLLFLLVFLLLEASKEQSSTWPHQRASRRALCNIYFTASLDPRSSASISGSLQAVFKARPGRRAKPHTGSRQPLTPTISQLHPQLHPSPARAHIHPYNCPLSAQTSQQHSHKTLLTLKLRGRKAL